VLPRFFFRPFCCSKTKWKGPPTNGNPSQSWRFSEEKRTPGAWNGRRYSAWTWPSPKWIEHFNKPRIRNCVVLSVLKTVQDASRRLCIGGFPFQLWRVGGIFKFSFLLDLKRAFKWFTGWIKTLGLALQKESAIESSKRNQNIWISPRTFWWQRGQQNLRVWSDLRFHKHLKWRRNASSRHALDKTDKRQIIVSYFD
jgi:hypothetical protein